MTTGDDEGRSPGDPPPAGRSDAAELASAEQALLASEVKYRLLYNKTPVMLHSIDAGGRLVSVSDRWLEVMGYEREEVIGQPSTHFLTEESRRFATEEILPAYFETGLCIDVPYQFVKKNGELINVLLSATAEKDTDGRVLRSLAVVIDVTERLRTARALARKEQERAALAEQLRHSQKMEAVGTLAGGIAHDFNNLLTGILGCADLLQRTSEPGSSAQTAADIIGQAARRAAGLTKQLLGFARRGKLEHSSVDVHELIRESARLLASTVDKHIEISLRLEARRANVMGDPDQLQQVLMNLALNARDAMPRGGELSLETDEVEGGVPADGLAAHLASGRYLRLRVRDTGDGIPADTRDRVFDPFFTTKPRGEGTGMGLATVYGIIRNHDGEVGFTSERGTGTTFEVLLPAADVAVPKSTTETKLVQGRATILVVDDEELVRQTACALLNSLGYRTVAVSGGRAAVDHYREHLAEVDLVILDLIMPSMSGRDCFLKLQQLDPDLSVLLCTGHALEGTIQELMDRGALGQVAKPYDLDGLSAAVEACLSASARLMARP